jgi:hypothetical protein
MVSRHGIEAVARAYPGWERADLLALLEESARASDNEYEPFSEFRPRPPRGRYVNVASHGYRLVRNQGPWPPAPARFNVLVFGGSTTFGAGLPDDESIPSLVGDRLARDGCGRPVSVYNFGRHGYISRQEGVLFEDLLASQLAVDLAVFVDGLNEFFIWPRPLSADLFREALARSQDGEPRSRAAAFLSSWPLARLARDVRWRMRPERPPRAEDLERRRLPPDAVIDQWKANRRHVERVARAYGVRTLFVWQPVPVYKYDRARHPLWDSWSDAYLTPARTRRGYERLDAERAGGGLGDGFLWLADVQEGRPENLYVSDYHYARALAETIAARIAEHVEQTGVLACRPDEP